jgi:DNA-binding GntR family transcriptional regulator
MGQPVSRRRLGAELGMSSVAVSEALLRLERDGLLESRPRAGTRVRIPTWEDVLGYYVLREALEAKTATLFAENATRDERSELIKLAIRVDNVIRQPEANRTTYLNLHEKLHSRIAECARCQALVDALRRVNAFGSIWLLAMHPWPAPRDSREADEHSDHRKSYGNCLGDARAHQVRIGGFTVRSQALARSAEDSPHLFSRTSNCAA